MDNPEECPNIDTSSELVQIDEHDFSHRQKQRKKFYMHRSPSSFDLDIEYTLQNNYEKSSLIEALKHVMLQLNIADAQIEKMEEKAKLLDLDKLINMTSILDLLDEIVKDESLIIQIMKSLQVIHQ
jgi:hypothetical protein